MTIRCALQGFRHSENLENFCECNEHLIFLLFRICFHFLLIEIIDLGSQPYGTQSHSAHSSPVQLMLQEGKIIICRSGTA